MPAAAAPEERVGSVGLGWLVRIGLVAVMILLACRDWQPVIFRHTSTASLVKLLEAASFPTAVEAVTAELSRRLLAGELDESSLAIVLRRLYRVETTLDGGLSPKREFTISVVASSPCNEEMNAIGNGGIGTLDITLVRLAVDDRSLVRCTTLGQTRIGPSTDNIFCTFAAPTTGGAITAELKYVFRPASSRPDLRPIEWTEHHLAPITPS